ncbi:hypothetical protein SSPS47_01935 [Streptomyces sp. S4.7]|uniref:hypothetical protein n=1 Tax=Streptomyces sp. S4.7 TaxID=2705439 RepID=UPI001397E4E3|nr:hypothetical protein [Streptomyces sp. S4.7]QHY93886.1 hypothetical protein SSPS47_01935 [Streptomyces sp. S4.7]
MTTRPDEGPEFGPDDPLAVLLRPTSDRLVPPPHRYEAIRRSATRRRLLRTAAGVGLSCAAAALVALPLHLATTSGTPASPTAPLAPPPPGNSSLVPTEPPSSVPVSPRPSERREPEGTPTPTGRAPSDVPSRMPMATPSQGPSQDPGRDAVEPPAAPDSGGPPQP